ncbi:hypothetical protein SNE40_013905 [Patella caerulea]
MSTIDGPHVIRSDMKVTMKQKALGSVRYAFRKFKTNKGIATYIKKEFDKVYKPNWHCVVGTDFGSQVTFCRFTFFHANYGERAVLLFQT